MTVSALILKLKLGKKGFNYCKRENENLLALIENGNSESSLIWSVISATQFKNEEKGNIIEAFFS